MTLRLKSIDELPPAHRDRARKQMAPGSTPSAAGVESPPAEKLAKKRRRYLNEPVELDGHRFDSKTEARRYESLRKLETSGLISELRVHTHWPLHAQGGKLLGEYVSDFDYMRDGELVVEDTKSPRTASAPLFRWKRLHFSAQYGLEIRELIERWKSSNSAGEKHG